MPNRYWVLIILVLITFIVARVMLLTDVPLPRWASGEPLVVSESAELTNEPVGPVTYSFGEFPGGLNIEIDVKPREMLIVSVDLDNIEHAIDLYIVNGMVSVYSAFDGGLVKRWYAPDQTVTSEDLYIDGKKFIRTHDEGGYLEMPKVGPCVVSSDNIAQCPLSGVNVHTTKHAPNDCPDGRRYYNSTGTYPD